jgi:hypothetical protein
VRFGVRLKRFGFRAPGFLGFWVSDFKGLWFRGQDLRIKSFGLKGLACRV